jgi:chromate transporter
LYMMKDFYLVSWKDIAINLAAIAITWALLSLTRLPSPVIVVIWLLLGWAMVGV